MGLRCNGSTFPTLQWVYVAMGLRCNGSMLQWVYVAMSLRFLRCNGSTLQWVYVAMGLRCNEFKLRWVYVACGSIVAMGPRCNGSTSEEGGTYLLCKDLKRRIVLSDASI